MGSDHIRKDNMFSKWMTFLRIMTAFTAALLVALFAGAAYMSDYCTDEIPDTTSIFVYTVDRGVEDLNRKYLNGKKITVSDESRYILYSDIPEIAAMDGVGSIYIFDDAVFNDFADLINSGETDEEYVAVPSEMMTYFRGPSGMESVFGIDPDTISGADEYVYIRCLKDSCELADGPVSSDVFRFYYKYEEATWDDFMARLENYIVEYDAISDVNMLITVSPDTDEKSVALQDFLMEKYPGSNYMSAEFARIFRNETNKAYWMKVLIFAAVLSVITVVIEIVITKAVKRVKKNSATDEN